MSRKVTRLEENLKKVGFKLSHKLYAGPDRDKTFGYVYIFSDIDGETYEHVNYEVTLDRTRTSVMYFCFTTRSSSETIYTNLRLEKLNSYYDWLKETVAKVLKDEADLDLLNDYEEPFVEESFFDDD